ncbi:MAG: hypothetical protein ACI87N_002871, partial [Flavobacteriales bacterium]
CSLFLSNEKLLILKTRSQSVGSCYVTSFKERLVNQKSHPFPE